MTLHKYLENIFMLGICITCIYPVKYFWAFWSIWIEQSSYSANQADQPFLINAELFSFIWTCVSVVYKFFDKMSSAACANKFTRGGVKSKTMLNQEIAEVLHIIGVLILPLCNY